jgi:hypothetical protein
MMRITLVGVALLSCATSALAEFPSSFPVGDYIYAGISEDGTKKVFIDQDPYRSSDEVSGAATILFSAEQTHSSGRHYWARRAGFSGDCSAKTIRFIFLGYEDRNGVIQFTDDLPDPMVIIPEKTAKSKSLGDIVLVAACQAPSVGRVR